jgi:WD40 repeat protein/tetratricopeptide (TPR) repeat protein
VLTRVCEDVPRPIREPNPEVPKWLCAVIGKLLAKKPEDRIQTAAEVADLLGRFLAHLEQPDTVAPPPPVAGVGAWAPRRRRKRALLAVAAVAVTLVAALGGYLAWRPADSSGPPDSGNAQEQAKGWQPRTEAELAALPSPLDGRKREQVPAALLALAGGGHPGDAPAELVAVLGDPHFHHEGPVTSVLSHPTGKTIITASEKNGDIRIWDPATKMLLRRLQGPRPTYGLALSRDGRLLAATGGRDGGVDGLVKVWDLTSGQEQATMLVPFGAQGRFPRSASAVVWNAAFSSDGQQLATAGNDWALKVWNAKTGAGLRSLQVGDVKDVAFSPDGKRLATFNSYGTLYILDGDAVRLTLAQPHPGKRCYKLAFSPDGRQLAAALEKGEVAIWDAATGKHELSLRGHAPGSIVRTVAFSPDGKLLASAAEDGTVKVWETATWRDGANAPICTVKGPTYWVRHLAFTPDSKCLISPGADGTVMVWNARTGREQQPGKGHRGPVWTVAVSPDGRTIASGGADGAVRLWGLAGWKAGEPQPPVRALKGHTATVYSVAFSPNGKLVASASHDGTIRLWGAEGKPVRTIPGAAARDKASEIAFSPDGKILAAGQANGSVRLWDVKSGEEQSPLRGHNRHVNSVAFSPDNRFLASAGFHDRKAHVTDLRTFRRLKALGPAGNGTAEMKVAFGGDGRTLAYGGWDDTIRLWDLEQKKETVLTGGGPNLNGLAVGPTGRFVAAARSWVVRLWDRNAPTRPRVIRFGRFGSTARHVAFTPEGRYVVVACFNGTVSILRAPTTSAPGPSLWNEDVAALARALEQASDLHAREKVLAEAAPRKGVLEKLAKQAADDGPIQAALAGHYAARGNAPLANAARAKARAAFERKLAKEPESSALAADLADLLLDQQEQEKATRWTVLKPATMKSEGGATLTLRPDGSVLASGTSPDRDVYSFVARTDLKQITAIRIEALPDSSLPHNGPGRFPGNGNFHLNKLRVFSGGAGVPLTKIVVAHSETPHFQDLIGGIDSWIGWSNHPRAGMTNSAVVATRLQRAADDDLKIELYFSQGRGTRQHNLGRFRLSVSGDPATFDREQQRLAAMKLTDPWLKLAVAYAVNGHNEEAAHYFSRALQRANGYEARKPILELAAGFDGALSAVNKRHDDPLLQLTFARQLAARGTQHLAEKQPAKAQAKLEKSRAIFTRLLAKYPRPQWTVLKPTAMISKGGATLSLLEDGSILASGTNPARDEYTVVARPALKHIRAIRLEALPDPSLPRNGPGRSPPPWPGNFHLNKLRVFSGGQRSLLTNMIVDHPNRVGNVPSPYQKVIDGEVDTSPGWGNYPRFGQANTATIATRIARAPKDDLKIEMVFSRSSWLQHNLGRFRLAVTKDAGALQATEFRKELPESEVADLNVALAKAHAQQGRTREAVASFTEALHLAADRAGKAKVLAEAALLKGVLEKLTEQAAGDGQIQAELARHYAARSNAPLANVARAKARALFEKKLAKEPENSALAGELADLLLIDTARWTVLRPGEMKAQGGGALTRLEDDSILVSGPSPAQDVYTLTFRDPPARIQHLRLEVLPHESLPGNGPGRYGHGGFLLTTIKAELGPPTNASEARSLKLARTFADFNQKDFHVDGAIDAKDSTGWGIHPETGKPHFALFELAGPVTAAAGKVLRVTLEFKSEHKQHGLGRFRLSVSPDAATFVREKKSASALKLTDPWAKLAAAYHVIGNQQALDTLLKRHPAAAAGIGDLYAADQDWKRAIAEYRKALTEEPADGALLTKLARAYASGGDTREAVALLAKASSADPRDTMLSLEVAALQAWFGQEKELAATRKRMLAFAKGAQDAGAVERAVTACSIRPSTDKAELAAVLALARTGARPRDLRESTRLLLALGVAEYRSGNHAAADQALRAARLRGGRNDPYVMGLSELYRAMSLFRQDRKEESRNLASAAAAKMAPLPEDEKSPLAGGASADDLILWLAYKEAKALIRFEGAPPPKAKKEK